MHLPLRVHIKQIPPAQRRNEANESWEKHTALAAIRYSITQGSSSRPFVSTVSGPWAKSLRAITANSQQAGQGLDHGRLRWLTMTTITQNDLQICSLCMVLPPWFRGARSKARQLVSVLPSVSSFYLLSFPSYLFLPFHSFCITTHFTQSKNKILRLSRSDKCRQTFDVMHI